MVDEGVVEPILDRGGELFAVLLIERQHRHDLVEQHLVHKGADRCIVHTVPHNIEPGQVRPQHKTGVRAVQNPHLAFFIRGYVGHNRAVEPGSLEWQLVGQPGGAFNVPDAENLADVDEFVMVAVFGVQPGGFPGVPDAAGHNPVHQGGTEKAVLVHPDAEAIAKVPLVNVPVHAFQQFLAVVVDQFTGKDHNPRLAGAVPCIQHLGELCGEGGRRAVLRLAGRVIDDAGFGCVRDNIFEIVRNGYRHHRLVPFLFVRVQAARYARNHPLLVDLLTVLPPAQIQGIQPLLRVDLLGKARGNRLYQAALAVPADLLVGQIKPVINEGAEKISFSELQHLFGCGGKQVAPVTGLGQGLVAECLHTRALLFIQDGKMGPLAQNRAGASLPGCAAGASMRTHGACARGRFSPLF